MASATPQVTGPLRLAELVAALSLATDLGSGQPLEHALRTCLLSLELARRSGVAADELATVYYLALLRFVGCTADASESAAAVGGDELAFMGSMAPAFMGSTAGQLAALVRAAGAGQSLPQRLRAVARTTTDAKAAERSLTAHCEAARLLSRRLRVSDGVTSALGHAYERWDGKGLPGHLAGEAVPPAVRVVVVARDVELWSRIGGADTVTDVVTRRRGHAYAPEVADAFLAAPHEVLGAAEVDDPWTATVDAEPTPWRRLPDADLETALEAFADFTDLKSPWLRGHSRAVAALAAAAAQTAGLPPAEVRELRLAGLVHDLGRVGIPNAVWDRPSALGVDAWEKVRLHPYLTERILLRSRRLAPLARLASCHHERSDGSGYHRGVRSADLTTGARLLAAADAYRAMTEPRPHRRALARDDACRELRAAADAGELDPGEVEAVVAAAGHPRRPGEPARPAGLSEREVEVLRLIARGSSNRQVAAELVISPKTVGAHVEHIYAKAGVSTRAGAALFAMEHGVL